VAGKKNQDNTEVKKIKGKLYDIHCDSCGAPAYYEIIQGTYKCRYCNGKVGVKDAIKQHKGFRSIQQAKMKDSLEHYEMQKASCTGCGAEVVFDKNDALATCAFCGRALVSSKFMNVDTIPELVIPFSITKEEAQDILVDWCKKNKGKKEAKELLKKTADINGCYLPYELIRGPVSGNSRRIEGGSCYSYSGFIEGEFVNCSFNLDNLLLDAMEPYNLDDLVEFDFAYVAGHQVKISDISDSELSKRISKEIEENYKPVIQKTLEAKAVDVQVNPDGIVRRPVLLPVYYIAFGEYMAAVNGQTGKVSVRAVKDSYYYIVPWWLKAVLTTGFILGIIALVMNFFGAARDIIETTIGCLAFFFIIVMLVAYSEKKQKKVRIEKKRKTFCTKGGPYVRKDGKLVKSKEELVRPETKPVFLMNLDGVKKYVELKFTTPYRVVRTLLLALIVLFFPVIIALFLNGFNFSKLNLMGSVVWFCLAVPLIPVYLVKVGRLDLYDNPWIYIINEDGTKKRYKSKFSMEYSAGDIAKIILKLLFKPPLCLAVWFGILCFCAICYGTAFGFD